MRMTNAFCGWRPELCNARQAHDHSQGLAELALHLVGTVRCAVRRSLRDVSTIQPSPVFARGFGTASWDPEYLPRRRTRMRRWAWPRCRSGRSSSRRSCRWGNCRCRCAGRCWRGCRSWCRCGYLSTREYPNVVNVLFMLVPVRVEVEGGRVSHVAAGIV
jgi:hypothetical protein